ncbi:MAG: metallophosphoesterase family protein [Candidatus Cryptobacteroides sp.]
MKKLISVLILIMAVAMASAQSISESLKGFIVSDSHFGWENDQQPAPEQQYEAITKIRERFPDLDVFIDTGDAHHNGLDRDKERGDWTDIILSQDIPVPFYYVPGNHEITHANDRDCEFTCSVLGSHEFRPYYSFDIKGVHFVSVPELIRAVYIPEELIEWLKLDLELNKDKTTILLSHNNLIGKSKTFEPGYRGVVNTNEILDIMNAYPNCIAWMYGHNHNYEIVKDGKKAFVSNGRIGGFDPSKGEHGLGGIYFEVSRDQVDIICYSAEYDKFIDELDGSGCYRTSIAMRTSLDSQARPAYSIGSGRAKDGEVMPLYHHNISLSDHMSVYMKALSGKTMNDDPEFRYFMCRNADKEKKDNQLMGCSISNNKSSYKWMDPGVLLFASEKPQTVSFPRGGHNKYTYYRVAPDKEYEIELDIEPKGKKGQRVAICPVLHDRYGRVVAEGQRKEFILEEDRQVIKATFDFGDNNTDSTIYSDGALDNVLNASVDVEFSNLVSDVLIRRCEIRYRNAAEFPQEASLSIDTDKVEFDNLSGGISERTMRMRTGNRTPVGLSVQDNGTVAWLLKMDELEWQVLGAPCADKDKSFVVGPLRNAYSHKKEVSINKYQDYLNSIFVCKMRNIDLAEIYPLEKGNAEIIVDVKRCISDNPEIVIYSAGKKLKIVGAESVRREGLLYILKVKEGSRIRARI